MKKYPSPVLSNVHKPKKVHNFTSKESKPICEKLVNLITQRAIGKNFPESFGLNDDVNTIGYESLLPALVKAKISDTPNRVMIGNSQCKQPYSASILNASALSFGPMGKPFILTLNKAAKLGGFYQNTGEAGISPYHFNVDINVELAEFNMDNFIETLEEIHSPSLSQAGDVVWQIGNGYFGCRKNDGNFDPISFQKKAILPNVKMIEIKLSQGVEPCQKMPVKKVTSGMEKIMGIYRIQDAVLQAKHSAFSSPIELINFASLLRKLSGGKPVGIKIGISHRHYFLSICQAMLKLKVFLDFITVDGMEAGTAAAPYGAFGYTGTSLKDSLLFVHNTLIGMKLRDHIKIIASGRLFTEKDIISALAHGADLCATARAFLLASGCDQQGHCYDGNCSKGIATQDEILLSRFDIPGNIQSMFNYHQMTLSETMKLLSIMGLTHTQQVRPFHLQKRINYYNIKTLDEIYEFLKPGSLLFPLSLFVSSSYKKILKKASPNKEFAAF